jgi:hypothetical protein
MGHGTRLSRQFRSQRLGSAADGGDDSFLCPLCLADDRWRIDRDHVHPGCWAGCHNLPHQEPAPARRSRRPVCCRRKHRPPFGWRDHTRDFTERCSFVARGLAGAGPVRSIGIANRLAGRSQCIGASRRQHGHLEEASTPSTGADVCGLRCWSHFRMAGQARNVISPASPRSSSRRWHRCSPAWNATG